MNIMDILAIFGGIAIGLILGNLIIYLVLRINGDIR